MKVRVAYTIEVSDDYRRAIRVYYGREGLASREEVQDWIKRYGTSEDDNLMSDLQLAEDTQRVENRICVVCGERIKDDEPAVQLHPPNGDWVHDGDEEGCAPRYWDAPGQPDPLEGDR